MRNLLTSLQNPQVKHLVALKSRKEREAAGEFIIEGRRFVEEALHRNAPLKQIYYCRELFNGQEWERLEPVIYAMAVPVQEIDERVCRKICGTENPQGILAVVTKPQVSWADMQPRRSRVLLIVDGVQDPGNLGTILRTALAAGVTQIGLTEGTVDPYNPKVLRSTMGGIFSLTVLTDVQPEEVVAYCRSNQLSLVTADAKGESYTTLRQLSGPVALIMGNEGSGPSQYLRENAEVLVQIPMSNEVESLNVSIAAAILLFEIARRHSFCL